MDVSLPSRETGMCVCKGRTLVSQLSVAVSVKSVFCWFHHYFCFVLFCGWGGDRNDVKYYMWQDSLLDSTGQASLSPQPSLHVAGFLSYSNSCGISAMLNFPTLTFRALGRSSAALSGRIANLCLTQQMFCWVWLDCSTLPIWLARQSQQLRLPFRPRCQGM